MDIDADVKPAIKVGVKGLQVSEVLIVLIRVDGILFS